MYLARLHALDRRVGVNRRSERPRAAEGRGDALLRPDETCGDVVNRDLIVAEPVAREAPMHVGGLQHLVLEAPLPR